MQRKAWDEAREGDGRLYAYLKREEARDEARESDGRLYGLNDGGSPGRSS